VLAAVEVEPLGVAVRRELEPCRRPPAGQRRAGVQLEDVQGQVLDAEVEREVQLGQELLAAQARTEDPVGGHAREGAAGQIERPAGGPGIAAAAQEGEHSGLEALDPEADAVHAGVAPGQRCLGSNVSGLASTVSSRSGARGRRPTVPCSNAASSAGSRADGVPPPT
jgi:hypothetical protein